MNEVFPLRHGHTAKGASKQDLVIVALNGAFNLACRACRCRPVWRSILKVCEALEGGSAGVVISAGGLSSEITSACLSRNGLTRDRRRARPPVVVSNHKQAAAVRNHADHVVELPG